MNATHYYVGSDGHTVYGVKICEDWMLCLCNDGKTWMRDPVFVGSGIRPIETSSIVED